MTHIRQGGGDSWGHTLLAALRAAGDPTRKRAENRVPGAPFVTLETSAEVALHT